MPAYYLRFRGPAFRSYHRVEASTLAAAKRKFLRGSTGSAGDVVRLSRVREGESRSLIPVGRV